MRLMLRPRSLAVAGLALLAGALPAASLAGSPVQKPGDKTIVEIAQEANSSLGEFDYLLAAVGCLTDPATGSNPIVAALAGDDRLTVFAPTDAAFEALQRALGVATPSPEATCTLPDAVVQEVLLYHVTEGRRFSNSVFNKRNAKAIPMLSGESVTANPDLTLTDTAGQRARLVMPEALANISARNGVVHVIDTVLLPTLTD